MQTIIINLLIFTALGLLTTRPAHAYFDPGSGSLILQVLLGAVLGGLVTVKIYFRKIKTIFSGISGKKDQHDNDRPKT